MFLICGEALYDLFLANEEPTGQLNFDGRPGGSPFNVALGMSRLGAHASLLTGLSDDMLGDRLAAILRSEGVGTDYLVRNGRRTTLSLVGVDEHGGPSYSFYGIGSADCGLTFEDVPTLGENVRGLHFGSYSIAVPPVANAFAELAARYQSRFISLDPNVRPTVEPDMAIWQRRIEALLPFVNLVKVSDEDLLALYPDALPLEIVKDWATLGPDMIVLTQGGEEVVAVRKADEVRHRPEDVRVVDTVGAGDSFMAALLASISARPDPVGWLTELDQVQVENLLRYAATAAGITCSRRGAGMPRSEEVETRLKETA